MTHLLSTTDLAASQIDTYARLYRLARWAAGHDGIAASVTRDGRVLLRDRRDGGVRIVRTLEQARDWLGY